MFFLIPNNQRKKIIDTSTSLILHSRCKLLNDCFFSVRIRVIIEKPRKNVKISTGFYTKEIFMVDRKREKFKNRSPVSFSFAISAINSSSCLSLPVLRSRTVIYTDKLIKLSKTFGSSTCIEATEAGKKSCRENRPAEWSFRRRGIYLRFPRELQKLLINFLSLRPVKLIRD